MRVHTSKMDGEFGEQFLCNKNVLFTLSDFEVSVNIFINMYIYVYIYYIYIYYMYVSIIC